MESDFRLRSYSYSAGRPVASARLSVDGGSGFYADGSATVVDTRGDALRFLGYQVDAGLTQGLGGRWILDVGVAHNQIRAAHRGALPYPYTEGYVGASHGPMSAYVFVSPNYLRPGLWTVYGQLEASFAPAPNWSVGVHVGSLSHVAEPAGVTIRHYTSYDWRLSASREIGNAEVHAALSGGGPGHQYYYGQLHSRTALTAGASISF